MSDSVSPSGGTISWPSAAEQPATGVRLRERRWERVSMWGAWVAIAAALSALTGVLIWHSDLYGYDYQVIEMPIRPLVAGLLAAGALFIGLAFLVHRTARQGQLSVTGLLIFIFIVGLALRVGMFWSEPVMEDDYQRYLWDGAVTANGLNPYSNQPIYARQQDVTSAIGSLAKDAGLVVDRVNHPHLRTIYPPVAQGLFALGYKISPFSLNAWRTLCLIGDLITFSLVLWLLNRIGRSEIWSALYWWNPVVVKEFFNSAHMEAVLLPFILIGIVFAVRRQVFSGTLALVGAIGIKLWPAFLLPLVWRNATRNERHVFWCLALVGVAGVLMALPILISGLNETSGFVAYAAKWQTNSAHFPALESIAKSLLAALGAESLQPGLIVRLGLASIIVSVSVWAAWRPASNDEDLILRAALIVIVMVLVSPAQFPWYVCWLAPFLCFRPLWGLVALMMTVSLYYYSFHLRPLGDYDFFRNVVVWAIWLPVWGLLLVEVVWRAQTPLRTEEARLA